MYTRNKTEREMRAGREGERGVLGNTTPTLYLVLRMFSKRGSPGEKEVVQILLTPQ